MHFADLVFNEVCPENRFLEEMASLVPWSVLKETLTKHIVRKTGGRPAYCLELMLRMHLLQTWHGLGDEATEFACRDRLSFRRFLGLGMQDKIPDATTLENFRHELEATGIDQEMVQRMDRFFKERGLLLQRGTMVDATFIKGNCKPKYDEDLKPNPDAQSDIDAEAGFKGVGYSTTTNVDKGTKLIRKVVVGSARTHDSQNLGDVMVGDETGYVFADSAYVGQAKQLNEQKLEAVLKAVYKRERGKKGEPAKDLSPEQEEENKWIAKMRAGVEHVYACWKENFKVKRAWYRGLERVSQQMHSLALAYNLRRWGYLCRKHGYC